MENLHQTPTKIPVLSNENQNTPPPLLTENANQKSQSPICNFSKTGTPDRLEVPKAFKFPERYTSPTDQMMSPVTRGILARSRKASKLLPPSINHPKIEAQQFQEVDPILMEKC